MKDRWDKFKILSDFAKGNKVLVLMGLTALGSGSTNVVQYFTSMAMEKNYHEGIAAVTQYEPAKTPSCNCNAYIGNLQKQINLLKGEH